jgi:phage terminase large subunit-like protein
MGGSDLRDFLTKCLNMWVNNTDDDFIDVDKWKSCGSDRTLADFRGQKCYIGIDCSSGGDLTTYALEFEDGSKTYWFSHSYMPRGRLEEHIETDLAPYDLWVGHELITVTGGAMDFKNDYKVMIADLKRIVGEYDLKPQGIGIDPHNADGILADLEEIGCPVIVVNQSCKSLNDATVDIQLLVKSEAVEYDKNNELLTWSFTNASIVRNSFDEIKVDKKAGARFKRIDPVDACVDAHAVRLKYNQAPVNPNDALSDYLAAMGWG